MGHTFGVSNSQQSDHMSHLSVYLWYIFVGQKNNCVFASHTVCYSLGLPAYIIGNGFETNWYVLWDFIR